MVDEGGENVLADVAAAPGLGLKPPVRNCPNEGLAVVPGECALGCMETSRDCSIAAVVCVLGERAFGDWTVSETDGWSGGKYALLMVLTGRPCLRPRTVPTLLAMVGGACCEKG